MSFSPALSRKSRICRFVAICFLLLLAMAPGPVHASSHREAPAITETPKVDATDLYVFRSYEPGREGFVTLIANYYPLQDPYGGPNFFSMDSDAEYYIHIDNDADAEEDISFRFTFQTEYRNYTLPLGGQDIAIPIINTGPIFPGNDTNLNVTETYQVDVVYGDTMAANPVTLPVTETVTSSAVFAKPVDNIGRKSIPEYGTYVNDFIYDVSIPPATLTGKVFVGQRKDPFIVNLGGAFDLINLNPLGEPDGGRDDLVRKNVTSLAIEVPISALVKDPEPVIGVWTTARLPMPGGGGIVGDLDGNGKVDSKDVIALAQNYQMEATRTTDTKPQAQGPMVQVSRLGNPLVNELIIGIPDKDSFNCGHPSDDSAFDKYFNFPVLPQHIAFLFDVQAPTFSPRIDLFSAFMTGLTNLNAPQNVASLVPSEMLRLNTAIPPTPMDNQDRIGAAFGDLAGFPNGRRPGDDVVDIALRVSMGVLLDPSLAPDGQQPFTDGALVDSSFFDNAFPYLRNPIPGAGGGPPPN